MHGHALLLCKSKSRGTNRPIRTLVYENWILITVTGRIFSWNLKKWSSYIVNKSVYSG
jgi:hypothetical protein